jgi:hypothetical protein
MRRAAWLVCAFAVACSATHEAPWVEHARGLSVKADQAIERGDRAGARTSLTDLVATLPEGGIGEGDRRVVLQDAMYRLANLELGEKSPRTALEWADRGLALGCERDLFCANLHIARGGAEEALGDRAAATRDLHEALVINDDLLGRALEGQP